jgi:hypothetical protein
VDGISLTVVEAGTDSFTVSLIPTTLELTTLGRKQPGEQVNLEVDVIAKHVERLLGDRAAGPLATGPLAAAPLAAGSAAGTALAPSDPEATP